MPRTTRCVLPPPPGDIFTDEAMDGLVGKWTVLHLPDGTSTPAKITSAALTSDGLASLALEHHHGAPSETG